MLTERALFAVAVGLYGLSALHALFLWRRGFRRDDWVNYALVACGLTLHTLAMVQRGFTIARCPVNNLHEVLMFLGWAVGTAAVGAGFWHRLRFLAAFASPVLLGIGVFALMPGLDPPYVGGPDYRTDWGSFHAALILLSCGSFGLASVAGFMYLKEDYDLKFNKARAVLSVLPPIRRLDRLTSGLLAGGLVLLTAGLALSPMLLRQKYGVYWKADPILIYSGFVWVLYLGLLVMRWGFGQGGRRLAWGAVGGFAFVLLTFWGFMLLSPSHRL